MENIDFVWSFSKVKQPHHNLSNNCKNWWFYKTTTWSVFPSYFFQVLSHNIVVIQILNKKNDSFNKSDNTKSKWLHFQYIFPFNKFITRWKNHKINFKFILKLHFQSKFSANQIQLRKIIFELFCWFLHCFQWLNWYWIFCGVVSVQLNLGSFRWKFHVSIKCFLVIKWCYLWLSHC